VSALEATNRHWNSVNQVYIIIKSAQLLCQLALHFEFVSPEIGSLTEERGSTTKLWKQVEPMATEVLPDAFISVYREKFANDLHSNDFTVSQGRLKAASAQGPILRDDFEVIINETENGYDKIFQREHIPTFLSTEIWSSVQDRWDSLSFKVAHGVNV